MELLAILDHIEAARPRCLVLGDPILDRYHHVEHVRDSDEGPIYRVVRTEEKHGGAWAVWDMCCTLGATGRGPYRCWDRMPRKTRTVLNGRIVHRIDEDNTLDPLVDGWAAIVVDYEAVLLADYGKGSLQPGLIRKLIDTANRHGIPVLVDPARGKQWNIYDGATIIKATAEEFGEQYRSSRISHYVMTLGANGMLLEDGDGQHFPTTPREPIDATGCGDQVLATLGVCLACGIDLPSACRLANVAAGLQTQRLGCVPVTLEELRAELGVVLAENR